MLKPSSNVTEKADRLTSEERDKLIASLITVQFTLCNSLFSTNGIVACVFFALELRHRHGIGTRATVPLLAFSEHFRNIPTMKALLQAGLNGLCQSDPRSDYFSVTVFLSALAGHVLLYRLLTGGKEVL